MSEEYMFEKYTEKARRVIFFARYEASQFGTPAIEAEHVLLGLLREDDQLLKRFWQYSIESIREEIMNLSGVKELIPTSRDLPLSKDTKLVLAYAAEESEQLQHRHIGIEHLLLGLLHLESGIAAEILHKEGLNIDSIRDELARLSEESLLEGNSRDFEQERFSINYWLTPQQLRKALDYQQANGGQLGTALSELGLLSRYQIEKLSQFFETPSITLLVFDVDEAATRLITREIAKKYNVLPISHKGNTLKLAMAEPVNTFAVTDIQSITGLNIEIVIAPSYVLEKAIKVYYGSSSEES
jgi:hypothetical protein